MQHFHLCVANDAKRSGGYLRASVADINSTASGIISNAVTDTLFVAQDYSMISYFFRLKSGFYLHSILALQLR